MNSPKKTFNLRVFFKNFQYERHLENGSSKPPFVRIYMLIGLMKIYNLRVLFSPDAEDFSNQDP